MKQPTRILRSVIRDRTGGPLAELAMLVPFLLFLVFGAFEFGRFLYQQHIITKGVQDAARYAARQEVMLGGTCPDPTDTWADKAKKVAVYGDVNSTTPLLSNFDVGDVTVTVACAAADALDPANPLIAPNPVFNQTIVITVSAAISVNNIGFFQFIDKDLTLVTLRAEHQEYGVGL